MDTQDIEGLKKQIAELLLALRLLRETWDMPDDTKRQREQRSKAWITAGHAIAAAEATAAQSAPASAPEAAIDERAAFDAWCDYADTMLAAADEIERLSAQRPAAADAGGLTAESAIPERENIVNVWRYGDAGVTLTFRSCRAASAFIKAVNGDEK